MEDFRRSYRPGRPVGVGVSLRSDEERQWEEKGFKGPVVQMLADRTATARGGQRIKAAIEAAAIYVDETMFPEVDDEVTYVVYLEACLEVDAIGLAGRASRPRNGGDRTERFPAFAGCGKGRRHASDGEAWSAALAQAAWKLEQESGIGFQFEPKDGELAARVSKNHGWLPELVPLGGLFPAKWECAVAAEHLRHLHTTDNAQAVHLAWAEVYNRSAASLAAEESEGDQGDG